MRIATLVGAKLAAMMFRHPYVVGVTAYLGASFAFAFASETLRLRRVTRELVADLEARTAEIEARMARAVAEEQDTDHGELSDDDWRELHRIMVHR